MRERFSVITAHYEDKTKEELAASGISPEFTPYRNHLRADKRVRRADGVWRPRKVRKKFRRKKKDWRPTHESHGDLCRNKKKTKLENGDINEGGPRVKKSRAFQVRKKEADTKRKDQELQATQLKCMQEQQQKMMSTLGEQLKQQQQQNQHMMMMICYKCYRTIFLCLKRRENVLKTQFCVCVCSDLLFTRKQFLDGNVKVEI